MLVLYVGTGSLGVILIAVIILALIEVEKSYKYKRESRKKTKQIQIERSDPERSTSYLQKYWDWEIENRKVRQVEAELIHDYSRPANDKNGETVIGSGRKLTPDPLKTHEVLLKETDSKIHQILVSRIKVLEKDPSGALARLDALKSIVNREHRVNLVSSQQKAVRQSVVRVYKVPVAKIQIIDATKPNYLKNIKQNYKDGGNPITSNSFNPNRWYKDYPEYLKSLEWKEKKQSVHKRANGFCEVCDDHKTRANHVHHVRYPKKWGEEEVTDLLAVCEKHHKILHGNVEKNNQLPF